MSKLYLNKPNRSIVEWIRNNLRKTLIKWSGDTSWTVLYILGELSSDSISSKESVVDARVGLGVNCIGQSAFEGCTSLSSVAMLASTATISQKAFNGCSSLREFTTSKQLTSMYDSQQYVQLDCSSIGAQAFADCSSLSANFAFPNVTYLNCQRGSTSNNYLALVNSGIKRLFLPSLQQFSGAYKGGVFKGMSQLEYIYMPQIQACDVEYAFRNTSSSKPLSVDFRGRQSTEIPEKDGTFFSTSSAGAKSQQ